MKRLFLVTIASLISVWIVFSPYKMANAGFGAEIPILVKILTETVNQGKMLQQVIGASRETVSILEEMNRGVKEVLRLAETAHVPLPPQVYETAKTIDEATTEAAKLYGKFKENVPPHIKAHQRSGVEGLFLSQDALEYSKFLDQTGEKIKGSAVVASQASATRLTAESMGVLLHAVSHGNRIQGKTLEILSTERLEESAKDGARFETFVKLQSSLNQSFREVNVTPLNSFGDGISSAIESKRFSDETPSQMRLP